MIESNTIALLSNAGYSDSEQIDPPIPNWLGLCAADDAVNMSGMWNVDFANGPYDPAAMGVLALHVEAIEP